MNLLLKLLSYIGLGLTIIPAIVYFNGGLDTEQYKLMATVGMVLWFVTAPFWINKSKPV